MNIPDVICPFVMELDKRFPATKSTDAIHAPRNESEPGYILCDRPRVAGSFAPAREKHSLALKQSFESGLFGMETLCLSVPSAPSLRKC